jgi:hypothetical protein
MPQPSTGRQGPSGRSMRGLIALSRCGVGTFALTRPAPMLRLLGYDSTTASRLAWLARLAGIRDLALGAGLIAALARGDDGRDWLWAGALADAGDAGVFATAGARRELAPLPAAASVLAAAGGVGLAALAERRASVPAEPAAVPDEA